MTRYLLPLGIVLVLFGFLAVGLNLNPREVPSPLIDKPAPDFSLPTLSDPQRSLSRSDLSQEVSLFNVWASWCVACRQEHPVLMELARQNRVKIYGLNYKDQREDALRWLQQFGNPYQESAHDLDGQVGIDWGVYGVPETFIVDRRGSVRYKHIGPVTPEVVETEILPLIEQLRKDAT